MEGYTTSFTAGDKEGGDHFFSEELAAFAKSVGVPKPEFRGKFLTAAMERPPRCQIETRIRGRITIPETPDEVYTQVYPDWSTGLEMAIHGALSRLCYAYHTTAPHETYFQYGWRNMEGVPFLRNVPLEKKPSIKFHMSELECHIVSVEDALAR